MDRRTLMLGALAQLALSTPVVAAQKKRPAVTYDGAEVVHFKTPERPGTLIVNTGTKSLYHVIGDNLAMRYGVAVGKEGHDWAGIAVIGRKVAWPRWTPPAQMIARRPELRRWRNGMPGGIPDNPLGARALYLFANGRDTLFRIHGTNEPWSIGSAASSGCIRMLNSEISDLYEEVAVGAKVIVL